MFCITFFVSFGSYKFISFNIFLRLFTIFLRRNSISFFIDKFCYYFWSRSSFLLVNMFCITFFVSFGSYKFISFNIFLRLFTIFLRRNSISFFIDKFCYYFWSRSSFLLVNMFCITFFVSFGSYKFISFNIFLRLFTIFLRRNSISFFIDKFCYYFWSRS